MSANTVVMWAALVFIGTHLAISSTPLRRTLVRALGERGYLGFYSLVAFASLGFLIYAYGAAPHSAFVYGPSPALNWIPVVVMPFALMLVVGGVTVRNPSAVMQDGSVRDPNVVQGFLRITRHPVQTGILLWALTHLVANGDVASLWFFGSFSFVSAAGMWLMDRKKAGVLGDDWQRFVARTSIVPMAAIAAGRNRLAFGEVRIAVLIGLGLWVVLLWGHRWIAGVSIAV